MSESMATHDADHSAQGGAAPAAGESAGVLLRPMLFSGREASSAEIRAVITELSSRALWPG